MFRIPVILLCCLILATAAGAVGGDLNDLLSRSRIIAIIDHPADGKKDDLYPDISHLGLACYPQPNFTADFLVTSTLPPGHQLFLSRNNGVPQPVASGRFTEPIREGKVIMTLSARGPLAAITDSVSLTIERHGNELIIPREPAGSPWPSTRAWQWDDPAYTATTALPVIARENAPSGAYAAKIISVVRERAATAKVSDAQLVAPFFLLPTGTQAPSELQVATAIIATAWRNGLPARLVLTRNAAERVRWLIEFYITELPRGRWILYSPETGAPFLRTDQQALATIEVITLVAYADKELPVQNAGQPVLIDDFAVAAISQENDFASNPRFRAPGAGLTFVTFQPTVEEYAGFKRWSERIGIGLFIVALLGIIGIKLFGPEEPETDGNNPPPPAA